MLTTGIGMASLPRDRFVGIQSVAQTAGTNLKHPLNDIGQLTLKALQMLKNAEELAQMRGKDVAELQPCAASRILFAHTFVAQLLRPLRDVEVQFTLNISRSLLSLLVLLIALTAMK